MVRIGLAGVHAIIVGARKSRARRVFVACLRIVVSPLGIRVAPLARLVA
jgi:hypothetical protein